MPGTRGALLVDMSETNFQKAMSELSSAFTTGKRDFDGATYTKLKDDAPAWIAESKLIYEAHEALDGRLPDDWVYENIPALAGALEHHDDADTARDELHEAVDGCVDVYNSARTAWLASHLGNAAFCDQAVDDGLVESAADLMDRIGAGQYVALRLIAEVIVSAVETEAEARDERDAEAADAGEES